MKSNSRFSHRQQKQKQKQKLIISYFVGSALISIVTLFIVLGSNLQFRQNLSQNLSQVIIAGIPLPIYVDVMTDTEAAFAFITGNRIAFRNRLKELNVEAKIRALYRPYFTNEIELERYIDQQFYDYTGYANRSEYEISEDGDLIRKMKPQNPHIKPSKPQGLFNFIKPSYPP